MHEINPLYIYLQNCQSYWNTKILNLQPYDSYNPINIDDYYAEMDKFYRDSDDKNQ